MPDPSVFGELFAIIRGYQRTQAVRVAAELGVADLLREGPRSAEELARATGSHGPTLYRLLRALASIGIFAEGAGRSFTLTPMGELLRTDVPVSLAAAARMLAADYEWMSWSNLLHSVRTGETASTYTLGMDVWEHRRRHPEDQEVFDAAMRGMSAANAEAEIAAYDFGHFSTVADIGGGTGAMLAAILRAFPTATGILFDQPQVIERAPPVLAETGVAERVRLVGGSFFEAVPTGAEAYILRRILHDWYDEEATAILRRCRDAMDRDARLVVIDGVVAPPNEEPLVKFLDLMMLVSAGGRERTEEEWRDLFQAGGFRLARSIPATSNSHILEGTPD